MTIYVTAAMGYSDEEVWDTLFTITRVGLLIGYLFIPFAYLLYVNEERSWVIANSLLFLFMSACLLILPLMAIPASYVDESPISSGISLGMAIISLLICWIAVIVCSPAQQLMRRLGFVVLGVLTLIGLSEISKRNLHQYLQPPKVSENLVR